MKKEVFLAIAIGFALGLVITFGIWTANKSLANVKTQPKPTETPQTEITPLPTGVTTSSSALTISAPEDETLTNQNKITVSGKTYPAATVVVTYEDDEQVVLADATGQFSTIVDLIAGYNIINITAFDDKGAEATQMLTITYSTAKI